MLGNGDLISAFPLIRYLQERRYEELADTAAVSFADRMRVPTVASYYAAVISVIPFFIAAIYATRD